MTALALSEAEELAGVARRAGEALEGAPAEEVLGWALETFSPRFALASSMAEAVLVDMASRLRPGVPVLFLDTGYHFAETLGTRDAVAARYDVEVVTVRPRDDTAHPDTPDRCCALRKVEPLERALTPYLAWATGIRRAETLARRRARAVEWDARRGKVKVNPLVTWSDEDVQGYVERHDVLVNPLLAAGYPSIGCAPCTRRVAPGEDVRAGRWAGLTKTECGLHA